jgi:hypothetical protein
MNKATRVFTVAEHVLGCNGPFLLLRQVLLLAQLVSLFYVPINKTCQGYVLAHLKPAGFFFWATQ